METVNNDMRRDPQDFVNRWAKRIGDENPILGKQLGWGIDNHPEGQKIVTIGVAFYAMLTAQLEADDLELFTDQRHQGLVGDSGAAFPTLPVLREVRLKKSRPSAYRAPRPSAPPSRRPLHVPISHTNSTSCEATRAIPAML